VGWASQWATQRGHDGVPLAGDTALWRQRDNDVNNVLDWFTRGKTRALSEAAILIGLIAWADYLSGYELGLGFFYLFPVMLVAWCTDRAGGLLMAGICAIVWAVVLIAAGHPYYTPLHTFWNSVMRLAVFAVVAYLVATLRSAFDSERYFARTDSLTKVTNRRHFLEILDAENRRRFGRERHPFSIAFIDIDDFKRLNDDLGHHVGDQALSLIAAVLVENVRDLDVVGRLGGDEFAILLPETDAEDAQIISARFLQAVSLAVDSRRWPIGLSVGVVTVEGGDIDVDRILQLADAMMYQAKGAGKNRIQYAVVTKETEIFSREHTPDPMDQASKAEPALRRAEVNKCQ
jgi:diguanylate cyclase (GGDEF)-like protein